MNQRHRVFVTDSPAEDQADSERFEGLFADIHDILVSESVDDIEGIDPSLKTESPPIRERVLTATTEHRITAAEVKCSDTFAKNLKNQHAPRPHTVKLLPEKRQKPFLCQL